MGGLLALAASAVLEGFAVLPADTLAEGPASGHHIEAPGGVTTPFPGQPVQGISALARAGDGSWWALADNGYGTRANSADFLLCIYRLAPDFRTAAGGTGTVRVQARLPLSRDGQELTGADFDPESLVRLADGSFWVGDEFGPFLLHFDARGALLEPPIRVPGAVAPEFAGDGLPANLAASRGLEGLGLSPDGALLHPLLEGSLPGEDRTLRILEFELAGRRFRLAADDAPLAHRYPLEAGATAIGALRVSGPRGALVVERDSGQGEQAALKRVYAVDFDQRDTNGLLRKQLVADLLDIADPHDLDADGDTRFRFDHQTTESIVVLDDGRLLLANDNNFPFGRARSATAPDPTEFIVLRPVAIP